MTYLLDTNVLLFLYSEEAHQLSAAQRAILSDPAHSFLLSEASLFELAIKIRQDRADFRHVSMKRLSDFRTGVGIKLLQTVAAHYSAIPDVQKVTHNSKTHGDPFDLLILAQAQFEQLPILSTDKAFPKYSNVTVIS
ncbi:type II toxin-antitoxin system VapC family toxin [Fibrella sp. WM1]|uniref:type II toxin-antitoxin system VapC family toxin n=1 Tax=Fibrella musci TaxID=3242485 RepID=UPI00351F8572